MKLQPSDFFVFLLDSELIINTEKHLEKKEVLINRQTF